MNSSTLVGTPYFAVRAVLIFSQEGYCGLPRASIVRGRSKLDPEPAGVCFFDGLMSNETPRPEIPAGAFLLPKGEGGYACWMALSLQALGPTGRVKVQYSSNLTGSVRLPSTTCPEPSSTV